MSLFDDADFPENRVKPEGKESGPRDVPAQDKEAIREVTVSALMEQVVSPENMRAALRRVERNKGASGVDKMTVQQLRPYLMKHWRSLKQSILDGTYQPSPVKRVEIPKPAGGVRLLGVPTVVDRLIQQALLQVLTAIFDPTFSDASYGFRPERRGHDAVRRARQYVRDGWGWVVDIDLEKFFDKVNHDILMSRVSRRIEDKIILGLIRRFLNSGIMLNGVIVASEEGTPQGGPLSPLLANILLDDLDKELETRSHRFVRYADDCNIYVRSRRAGERVRVSVTRYLRKRLKLTVNESKSAVDRPWKRKFLGFSLIPRERRIRMAPQTLAKVKDKIRSLTQRSKPWGMDERIEELNQYLGGWIGYFALAETPSVFTRLDEWIRARLRMCQWKQWKRIRTRVRQLRSLGLRELDVWEAAGSRKGYWRIAHSPPLHKAMGIAYWRNQGLISLTDRYQALRQAM